MKRLNKILGIAWFALLITAILILAIEIWVFPLAIALKGGDLIPIILSVGWFFYFPVFLYCINGLWDKWDKNEL